MRSSNKDIAMENTEYRIHIIGPINHQNNQSSYTRSLINQKKFNYGRCFTRCRGESNSVFNFAGTVLTTGGLLCSAVITLGLATGQYTKAKNEDAYNNHVTALFLSLITGIAGIVTLCCSCLKAAEEELTYVNSINTVTSS